MSKQIWELVQCMSFAERSSFKRHVGSLQKKEDVIYAQMFESIHRMKTYREKDFVNIFGKGNTVSRMKNYLYVSLLSSLKEVITRSDATIKCKNQMNIAFMLYQKGLLGQSKKMVEKVILIAKKNKDLYSEAEAFSLQRLILMNELDLSGVKESISQEKVIREKIEQQQTYEFLYVEFVTYVFKKGSIINAEDRLKLETFIKDENLIDIDKCLTRVAKSYFYRIYTLYYGMIGNYDLMHETARKRFELYNEKEMGALEIQNVINSINNYIESCLIKEEFQMASFLCEYLRKLNAPTLFYEARKMIRSTILQLQLNLSPNFVGERHDLSIDIETCLQQFDRFLRSDERLELLFLLITLEFNNKNYKLSRSWIREYYKLNKSKIRIDLQLYIMIINIYINYINKDLEYAVYLIQSLERFEKNEGLLDNYEEKLLAFLKKELANLKKPNEVDLILITKELIELKSKRNEMSLAKYIDFTP